MKRSAMVILGSVATVFAGMCVYGVMRDENEYTQVCVDGQDVRIPDEYCEDEGHSHGHWFYAGSEYSQPSVGSKIKRSNGSFVAPKGATINRVSTGGFGGRGSGGST